MKNYSRQREVILNVIRSTNTHPTASWIYNKSREQLPNISLGTVYRNLSGLVQSGDILSINVGDGQEHYDGDISAHLHLHCEKCKCISDVMLNRDPLAKVAVEHGFSPKISAYVMYGVCENCNK